MVIDMFLTNGSWVGILVGQVSVYQIPAYGACFYIVCYLPSTSCRYPIPVPYSELRGLMPDTRLAVESPDTVKPTRRAFFLLA